MFCKHCGRRVESNARFCPHCGHETGIGFWTPMKKLAAVIITAVIVLSASVATYALAVGGNIQRNDYGSYAEISDSLDDVMQDASFKNASTEKKKEIVQKQLDKCQKDGLINKNSVVYKKDNEMFWYKWGNGYNAGVMLNDFEDGFSGKADKDKFVKQTDSYGLPSELDSNIDFSDGSYPYAESDIAKLNLKAKYMFGLCDSNDTQSSYYSFFNYYKNNEKAWNSNHLSTQIDEYCTVDDFKTGLNGYDVVFIEEHGNFDYQQTPMICTKEKVDEKQLSSKYAYDLKHNYIAFVHDSQTDNSEHCWIYPSFFRHYYSGHKLEGTVIWLGSCHGYQNSDLVNAFTSCGAAACIGYDQSVLTVYDCYMHTAFTYGLMWGESVSDALGFAKEVCNSSDSNWASNSEHAQAKISGKSNFKIIKIDPKPTTTEPPTTETTRKTTRTTRKTTEKTTRTTERTTRTTKQTTKRTEPQKLAAPKLGEFYDSTNYSPNSGDGVMVTCEWTSVSGADGYEYYCVQDNIIGSPGSYTEQEKTTDLYYTTGASDSIKVTLKVRAYKVTSSGTIYSPWSNTASCELNTKGGICRKDVPYDTEPEEPETQKQSNSNYKQAYKDVMNNYNSIYTDNMYTLYDMNDDGTPELAVVYGTCNADYQLAFYTFKNGKAVNVGDHFSGFSCEFYKDNDNDELCLIMRHMELASITHYAFDGSKVTESDYIDFSNDDNQNKYGDFSELSYAFNDDFSIIDNY